MRCAIPGPLGAARGAREDCRLEARRQSAPIVFPSWSPPLVLARLEEGSQLFGDCLACTEYPRADRADRAIHDRCDVLIAQAFELAQRDGVAQLLRQSLHRVVYRLRDLLGHHHALRRVDIAQLLAILKTFGVLGIELGRGRSAPAHGHQVVLGRIDADAVQPCIECAVAPERGQCAIRFDECFLCDILDLDWVPDKPGQQPRQLALVLRHQQFESMLVASLGPLDQLPVEIPLIHLPPSLTKRCRASVLSCPQAAAVYPSVYARPGALQLQTRPLTNSSARYGVIPCRPEPSLLRIQARGANAARPEAAEGPRGGPNRP